MLYDAISDSAVKREIAKSYAEKELQLMQLKAGQVAPAFSLPDEKGKVHHLEDFRGQVIYIDFWASWCAPCRAEMPNFKNLRIKFKGNSNISFISIAIWDREKDWRKALAEEKPDWLQLHDTSGAVAKSYLVLAIPKYVLIDKHGNVVMPNAPAPGDQSIESMIINEIAKP